MTNFKTDKTILIYCCIYQKIIGKHMIEQINEVVNLDATIIF